MKRSPVVLSLFLALAGTAANAFEGNLTYEVTKADGTASTVTCQIKGDRVLATSDLFRGQGTMLVIPKEKALVTIVPMLRLAMKQDMPDVAASVRSLGNVQLQATTRTETVAGTPCTVYTFRSDDAEGETCNAEGMDSLYRALGSGADLPRWAQDVMKKGLFPLRATGKDKAGKKFRLEATQVRKTQLPAALFSVPPDFHVTEGVDLGGLMGGHANP